MRDLNEHPVTQWVILGFAAMAFIIAFKSGVAYLPDNAVTGAIKKVVSIA